MWEAFIERMTGGDKDFARYLQMVAGMAAVGKVYEEGMLISHGPGGNGKSTLVGAWSAVLGDYAETIRPELLMARANGQEAFGMDAVRGKRLVTVGETEEGARLSASVMKRLASRDDISANPKGKPPFTFTPTHTLVLHTNYLPRLRSLDAGTRRRIAIAPFTETIQADEMITDYGTRLFEREGDRILGWIIKGAKMFWDAERKLSQPEIVVKATRNYFEGEDWIGNFLNEKCEEGPNYSESGSILYAEYRAWAEANGEYVRRGNDFAKELEKRGFEKRRGKKGSTWSGIQIAEDDFLDR